MNKIILFISLLSFISCGNEKRPAASVAAFSSIDSGMEKPRMDTIIHNTPICHNHNDEVKKFSFPSDSIEISLHYVCLDNSLVESISQNLEGKFEKHFYNDYKILISFTAKDFYKEFSITKEDLEGSIDNSWLHESIIGNSFIDSFSLSDTSVSISPFIGNPAGDNGVIVNLKIGYNSGVSIINIVEPEFE